MYTETLAQYSYYPTANTTADLTDTTQTIDIVIQLFHYSVVLNNNYSIPSDYVRQLTASFPAKISPTETVQIAVTKYIASKNSWPKDVNMKLTKACHEKQYRF